METFEPPRTLEMGGDGNGLYPHGDEKRRSYYYYFIGSPGNLKSNSVMTSSAFNSGFA